MVHCNIALPFILSNDVICPIGGLLLPTTLFDYGIKSAEQCSVNIVLSLLSCLYSACKGRIPCKNSA